MARYIPLILFTVLTNALAQILLKHDMLVTGQFSFNAQGIAAVLPRLAVNPFLVLGMAAFVVSMASHLLGATGLSGGISRGNWFPGGRKSSSAT